MTPDVWEMLTWVHRFEEHSLLPIPGAGTDQTAAFIAALDLVPYYRAKLEKDLSENGT